MKKNQGVVSDENGAYKLTLPFGESQFAIH